MKHFRFGQKFAIALMLLPMTGTAHPVPEFGKFIKKAKRGEPIVVAYLGGSITVGATTYPRVGKVFDPETESWRALSYEWLRARFEQKQGQFRQVNAGIGGTSSLLGAYRLEQDVLNQKPDLVFIEFAVNDNGRSAKSILQSNRSMVERLRAQNPDVVLFMPLSPHRMLEGSKHTAWSPVLDQGHDRTRQAAEILRVPYLSLREAFYGNPATASPEPLYAGEDTAGNYVHPAPLGHKRYAEAVEKTLSEIFKTGTFDFNRTADAQPVPSASPLSPKLILPEILIASSKGWKVEADNGKTNLVATANNGELAYSFTSSAVALWFDIRGKGTLEIYLDGIFLGVYSNGMDKKEKFQGRFCPLADSLDQNQPHTLRLVPLAGKILLRAVAIDTGTTKQLKVAPVELIYTEDEIPIRYDGSLSTIRRNGEMYFFHSFGCRFPPIENEAAPNVRRSRHSWHKGTPDDPLKVHLMSKTEEELWDYNGYYQDENLKEEGIWILGMYECPNGDLLAITHAELNFSNEGKKQHFAMGLGYSTDHGKNWIYCGEIIRAADDRVNIGGGAYIVHDGYLMVYYNDTDPKLKTATRRRIRLQCVARAKLDEVIAAAARHKVTPWYKYADGKWDTPALSNQPGEDLIPHATGREDLHTDATYCTALEKYLLTIQTGSLGRLLLFSSSDGLDWKLETIVDRNDYQMAQPYSSFVDFDGPSADGHTVDGDFYLYFPRKNPKGQDYDYMYRRKITIE